MDDNERKIKLDELNELRNKLINFSSNELKEDNSSENKSNSKVKVLANGKYKGEKDNNLFSFDYDKAGMINVIMLAIITFSFECLFLILSLMIFE